MIVAADKRVIKREDEYSLSTITKPGEGWIVPDENLNRRYRRHTNARKVFPLFSPGFSSRFTKQSANSLSGGFSFGVFTTVKLK